MAHVVVKRASCPALRAGPERASYNRSVQVTVLLFASLAEAAGKRRVDLAAAPGETVAQVRDRLLVDHPELARFVPNLLYALDEEYADEQTPVSAGATLALIPPVSGG